LKQSFYLLHVSASFLLEKKKEEEKMSLQRTVTLIHSPLRRGRGKVLAAQNEGHLLLVAAEFNLEGGRMGE